MRDDANTAGRRAWLAVLQGNPRSRIGDSLKTALFLVLILTAYGIVGRLDYEDELMWQAERNSCPQDHAPCNAAPLFMTSNAPQGERR